MGVTLGTLKQSLVKNGLLANSSQMIGPKGLKISAFDGDYPGVVARKFGEDRSKTLPVELFSQNFLVVVLIKKKIFF